MLYICTRNQQMNGALVQLVRIRACHARGQGFESPTHRRREDLKVFSFFVRRGLVQLVAPRVTNLRMAVVCCANNCLCQMIVFENKFSAIICQTQQSSIATATLRSPLGFCRRSSPVLGGKFVCFFRFSFFRTLSVVKAQQIKGCYGLVKAIKGY